MPSGGGGGASVIGFSGIDDHPQKKVYIKSRRQQDDDLCDIHQTDRDILISNYTLLRVSCYI